MWRKSICAGSQELSPVLGWVFCLADPGTLDASPYPSDLWFPPCKIQLWTESDIPATSPAPRAVSGAVHAHSRGSWPCLPKGAASVSFPAFALCTLLLEQSGHKQMLENYRKARSQSPLVLRFQQSVAVTPVHAEGARDQGTPAVRLSCLSREHPGRPAPASQTRSFSSWKLRRERSLCL